MTLASGRDIRPHVTQRDPSRLRFLLSWAYKQWSLETPSLGHSVSLTDEGGSPDMKAAAKAYLGLLRRGEERDDWERTATRLDKDGFYITPLRAAMTRIRTLAMRRFLHDLVPNAMLRPSDIAELHGSPGWAEAWVMQGALEALYREFHAAPVPQRSWVDLSTSQQNAEADAERRTMRDKRIPRRPCQRRRSRLDD